MPDVNICGFPVGHYLTEMNQENKYKEYSTEKVSAYKNKWAKDFFNGVSVVDFWEVIFVGVGVFIFIYLSLVFKITFIVTLVLFYWFRIKCVEKKIVEAKQFLVLGSKFLDENFKGRGVTKDGVEPHYKGHERGFEDYIGFL